MICKRREDCGEEKKWYNLLKLHTSHYRKMIPFRAIVCLLLPLPSACYEAIHHEILDREPIILYIEGQRRRLREGIAEFNHLPVFALNKGQCYFYRSIAAGGGGGDSNPLRDSPALR